MKKNKILAWLRSILNNTLMWILKSIWEASVIGV